MKMLIFPGFLTLVLIAFSDRPELSVATGGDPVLTRSQNNDRNKAIVLKCIAAYARQDSNYILSNNAPDVVNVYSGRPPIRGLDSCRLVLREAFQNFKDYHAADQVAVADSDFVFVFQNAEGTNRKTGQKRHIKQVEIFKFNNAGKIVLHAGVSENQAATERTVSFADKTLPKTAVTGITELPKEESERRNKSVVANCFAAYAAKDSNYLLSTNTDDVVNIYSGRPWVRGADSARATLRQAFSQIKEYNVSHPVTVADGHYVFVFQYVDMSFQKGDFVSHAKQVEMFKFNDAGKLIVHSAVTEDLLPGEERVVF